MPAIASPPAKRGRFRVTEGIHVQDGRVYSKGHVVESTDDLANRFKNKFVLVDPHTPVTKVPVTFTPHTVPPPPGVMPQQGQQPQPQIPSVDTEGEPQGPTGADVTAKFEAAVENDYKVYKQGGKYFVYDADDLTQPINPTGVGKSDVASVIAGAMGSDAESEQSED